MGTRRVHRRCNGQAHRNDRERPTGAAGMFDGVGAGWFQYLGRVASGVCPEVLPQAFFGLQILAGSVALAVSLDGWLCETALACLSPISIRVADRLLPAGCGFGVTNTVGKPWWAHSVASSSSRIPTHPPDSLAWTPGSQPVRGRVALTRHSPYLTWNTHSSQFSPCPRFGCPFLAPPFLCGVPRCARLWRRG